MANDDIYGLLGTNDLLSFQNSIQQTDPYGIIGKAVSSWQPNYSTFSPTESAVTAFSKAFLGGLMQNYAQNRASDQLSSVVNILPQLKTDPYSVAAPEGVDSSAFNILKGTAILKNAALEENQGQKKETRIAALLQGVLPDLIKNRQITAKDALNIATSDEPTAAFDFISSPNKQNILQTELPDSPLANGRDSSAKKLEQYYLRFLDSGMPPTQAATAAKEQIAGELKANNQSFDEARAAREASQKLFALANTAEAGMSQAGQTGSKIASMYEKTLSAVAPWSTPEADKQAAGDALISSIAPDLLIASRPPGVGAMSDPEMRIYLSTGPSPDKTPEQNAVLIEKMKNVAKLNSDYADFLDAYRDANSGSTTGASQKWAQYTQAFPTFKGGEMDLTRPSWQDYFEQIGSGQNPNAVVMQDTIRGSQSTDQAASAQPVPTGEVTKSGKKIYILNGVKGTID